jgi:hypothetical protein
MHFRKIWNLFQLSEQPAGTTESRALHPPRETHAADAFEAIGLSKIKFCP